MKNQIRLQYGFGDQELDGPVFQSRSAITADRSQCTNIRLNGDPAPLRDLAHGSE
jgi:hypothetical protein